MLHSLNYSPLHYYTLLDYSPTKTQKVRGNPDESANPTASSPACARLAGEHCSKFVWTGRGREWADRLFTPSAWPRLCV